MSDEHNTRRQRRTVASAAIALAGVAVFIVVALRWQRPAGTVRWTQEHTVTLAVEAFQARDPGPRAWTARSLAESLATRFGHLPGLVVHQDPAGFTQADFTLRGNINLRDGRLVIAVRLYAASEQQPIWSATFWREDAANGNLVADLSADVAEALYGHLGRSAVSSTVEAK